MSTLAIRCRVVRSRDVRSRVFSRPDWTGKGKKYVLRVSCDLDEHSILVYYCTDDCGQINSRTG